MNFHFLCNNMFTNEVDFQFNVIGSSTNDWIMWEQHKTEVNTQECMRKEVNSSASSDYIYNSSNVVWERARYLASVLDCETNGYFLELHDRILGPKKMHELEAEQWSSGSLAQSESLYTWRENLWDKWVCARYMPWVMVPLRYRIMRLTSAKRDSEGEAMNGKALFTLNAISGLVRVTYYNALTCDID